MKRAVVYVLLLSLLGGGAMVFWHHVNATGTRSRCSRATGNMSRPAMEFVRVRDDRAQMKFG